jgi:hypothetical protein
MCELLKVMVVRIEKSYVYPQKSHIGKTRYYVVHGDWDRVFFYINSVVTSSLFLVGRKREREKGGETSNNVDGPREVEKGKKEKQKGNKTKSRC